MKPSHASNICAAIIVSPWSNFLMDKPDYKQLCAELADSIELLLEMRPVEAKPLRITEDRLARARAALAEPAVDEVAELVAWLRATAETLHEGNIQTPRLTRAADLLERLVPQPVPVTERLPGPEDCVVISWSELRSPHVWAGKRRLINGPTEIWDWTFASIPCLEESGEFTHWLPASASVLPAGAIRPSNPSA